MNSAVCKPMLQLTSLLTTSLPSISSSEWTVSTSPVSRSPIGRAIATTICGESPE